ncbi:MAG: hypothetical protein ACK42Y_00595 [Candidatus Thermochlorobacter sp.]
MMRVPLLFVSLLLMSSLTGCYTKFFADDDPLLSRNMRAPETQIDTIEDSNGELTVIIQEYFSPHMPPLASPFLGTWGYTPFWSDPWFDRFFLSPWSFAGFGWSSPYWAWYGGWGGYPRWTWAYPVRPWVQVPIVVAPATPVAGTPRNFGRIRHSSILPSAVAPAVVPVASPQGNVSRPSSESASDKRNAVRRTVSPGYYTLPWTNSEGTPSTRRQSSSSGSRSTVSSSSSTSVSPPSSGSSSSLRPSSSSSSSSSSGIRRSGRTR